MYIVKDETIPFRRVVLDPLLACSRPMIVTTGTFDVGGALRIAMQQCLAALLKWSLLTGGTPFPHTKSLSHQLEPKFRL